MSQINITTKQQSSHWQEGKQQSTLKVHFGHFSPQ